MSTLDDQEYWGLARLAHLLFDEGRMDEARAIFEGLTVTHPAQSYPWAGLGSIARSVGDLTRAAELLGHALRLEESSHVRLQLAEVLILGGRQRDAAGVLAPLLAGTGPMALRARALAARCAGS